jgi:hypothetical protein
LAGVESGDAFHAWAHPGFGGLDGGADLELVAPFCGDGEWDDGVDGYVEALLRAGAGVDAPGATRVDEADVALVDFGLDVEVADGGDLHEAIADFDGCTEFVLEVAGDDDAVDG